MSREEVISVSEKELFAQCYYNPHNDIYDESYREYWFKGGRGSLKSSFCSIETVLGVMQHSDTHAVVLRKTASTCRGSVFKQIEWAINKLGVRQYWESNLTELKWIYLPTKQEIIFRGVDDKEKLKSLKQPFGYYRYLWFEELTEFDNMKEVRSVIQTVLRGGRKFQCFMSYNPPASASSWVNVEARLKMDGRIVYHSTYLDVPREWLGEEFFQIAEALKAQNYKEYAHEYLGEVTGTGGQYFENIEFEDLSDKIPHFDNLRYGVDFGKRDPNVFAALHIDWDERKIYIFDEIYRSNLRVRKFAQMIEEKNTFPEYVTCDNADTTAIDILDEYNINVRKSEKGKGSIKRGLDWLQNLDAIVIDPNRCPELAREFAEYEYKTDRNGVWTDEPSEKNNHGIDAVRYALEQDTYVGGLGS